MPHRTILVAIGANLPGGGGKTPLQTCRTAVRALSGLPGLRLERASAWFASPAWPPSDQPGYVNGVVLLQGAGRPEDLLRQLHAIEHDAGRRRTVANAARPLDLDLLGVGSLVIDTPTLTLPHCRLHLRRFVLLPLAEVAPEWVHPILGQSPQEMLDALPDDGTHVMEKTRD